MALNTLDYEERQQYILKIRAYDIQSSESSEVNLNITILVSIPYYGDSYYINPVLTTCVLQ